MARWKLGNCEIEQFQESSDFEILFRGLVGILKVDAQVTMDASFTVDPEAKSFFRDLVENPFSEFDDIFLKGFVAGWVIQYFPDDAGVSRTQDIFVRNPHQISNSKTGHKRIV
jgi:hypothetical protein